MKYVLENSIPYCLLYLIYEILYLGIFQGGKRTIPPHHANAPEEGAIEVELREGVYLYIPQYSYYSVSHLLSRSRRLCLISLSGLCPNSRLTTM